MQVLRRQAAPFAITASIAIAAASFHAPSNAACGKAPAEMEAAAASGSQRRNADSHRTSTSMCDNWAGYTMQSSPSGPTPVVTGISASWAVMRAAVPDTSGVPPDSALKESTDFAQWVGLDGDMPCDSSTLAQGGTESTWFTDSVSYTMWYEFLPAYSVTVGKVRPGDTVYASVSYDSTDSECTVFLDDMSSGLIKSMSRHYPLSMLNADIVLEDVSSMRNRLPISEPLVFGFGKVYTGIPNTATIDGFTGGLQSFPRQAQVMSVLPKADWPVLVPTPIRRDGSFAIVYLAGPERFPDYAADGSAANGAIVQGLKALAHK